MPEQLRAELLFVFFGQQIHAFKRDKRTDAGLQLIMDGFCFCKQRGGLFAVPERLVQQRAGLLGLPEEVFNIDRRGAFDLRAARREDCNA